MPSASSTASAFPQQDEEALARPATPRTQRRRSSSQQSSPSQHRKRKAHDADGGEWQQQEEKQEEEKEEEEYVVSEVSKCRRTWVVDDGTAVKGTMQFLVHFQGYDRPEWLEVEQIGPNAAFHDFLEQHLSQVAVVEEKAQEKGDQKGEEKSA
jgi:hypothetical protein